MAQEKTPAYTTAQAHGLPFQQQAQAPSSDHQQQPLNRLHHDKTGNDHNNAHADHDFGTGLFDCSTSACLKSWCPCIVYSEVKQRFDHLDKAGAPLDDSKVEAFDNTTLPYIFLGCILDGRLRGEMRKRYHIKGDGGDDFWTVCCCHPCAQQQMLREVRLEEAKAPVVQQQMDATAPMTVA